MRRYENNIQILYRYMQVVSIADDTELNIR